MSTVGHYPTAVSDAQWDVLQLLLPPRTWRPGGAGRKPLARRRVITGIFSVNTTGCQWRLRPTDSGHGQTIDGYFRRWRREGNWARVMETRPPWERRSQGRLPAPSAGWADSPRSKAATPGPDIGVDGHKQGKGRQRPMRVDPRGLLVAGVVPAANTDDRPGWVAL